MSSGGRKKYFFVGVVDMAGGAWYHGCMSNVHHNNEDEHFPCSCHRPEYAYTDSLCPECEDAAEREREETRERLDREAEERHEAEADHAAFIDAASSMSPEDWDADNDWLASAGWGEM
jgi:hypothetical protein